MRSENAGEEGEEAQFIANLVVDSSVFDRAVSPVGAVVVIDAAVEEEKRLSEAAT